jgi:hypothetical protein
MASAKDLVVAPIAPRIAGACIKRHHYSGKVVPNSQLHLGVFLNGRLEGAMQFGPSLDKRKLQGLVAGTQWNGFIELNRMAFSDRLPRNAESRCLGIALRLIRKQYPHIEWVVSFADGTQCGDGTIYRASGFELTGITPNKSIWQLPSGQTVSAATYSKGRHILQDGASGQASLRRLGGGFLPGFQLRYVYFVNPAARDRLTVPILPFSAIEEAGASMYRGQRVRKHQESACPADLGGETPTRTLQNPKVA